jgi:fumarylpyruvate hydrolase
MRNKDTKMKNLAILAPKITTIPIVGSSDSFPVRRIYCIGRNYAEHTIEMGGNPDRESPFFFQKNSNNADSSGEFPYPTETNDVHYEVELTIALKSGGKNITEENANSHIFGYAVGLDMTRRDLQSEMKALRRPWEIGKSFERSAPIGEITRFEEVGYMDSGLIELKVNGNVKQTGDLNQMIWKVPEIIAYLSRFYDIDGGDLIMSGTPAGVGPVVKGDQIVASVKDLPDLKILVV